MQVLIKDSEEMMEEYEEDEEGKDVKKKEEEYVEEMEEGEEKEAARQYYRLHKRASYNVFKLATAGEGEKPGEGAPANSLTDAKGSLAEIDKKNRPADFAGTSPTDEPSDHTGKEEKAAGAILANILSGKHAMESGGLKPGDGIPQDLAAADGSLAEIDRRNRPADFASGHPTDEPSAMIGQEEKISEEQAFEVLFKKTAEKHIANLSSFNNETKIAHVRALMVLSDPEQAQYINALR